MPTDGDVGVMMIILKVHFQYHQTFSECWTMSNMPMDMDHLVIEVYVVNFKLVFWARQMYLNPIQSQRQQPYFQFEKKQTYCKLTRWPGLRLQHGLCDPAKQDLFKVFFFKVIFYRTHVYTPILTIWYSSNWIWIWWKPCIIQYRLHACLVTWSTLWILI